jgi:hypothetical protein
MSILKLLTVALALAAVPAQAVTLICWPDSHARHSRDPVTRTRIFATFVPIGEGDEITSLYVTHYLASGRKVDRRDQYRTTFLGHLIGNKTDFGYWGWMGVNRKHLNRHITGELKFLDGNTGIPGEDGYDPHWTYIEFFYDHRWQTGANYSAAVPFGCEEATEEK